MKFDSIESEKDGSYASGTCGCVLIILAVSTVSCCGFGILQNSFSVGNKQTVIRDNAKRQDIQIKNIVGQEETRLNNQSKLEKTEQEVGITKLEAKSDPTINEDANSSDSASDVKQNEKPSNKSLKSGERYPLRTWKDNTGKFEVVARFRSYANGIVKLRLEDDSIIEVPLERLDDDGKAYVEGTKRPH